MTPNSARKYIIMSSLLLVGFTLIFFILSPYLGYPLEFNQSMRLMQIVLPVFFGYLGSAVTYIFSSPGAEELSIEKNKSELLKFLVIGPIVIFSLALGASLVAFGLSNSDSATIGQGISVDELASLVTTLLGLISITVGSIVVYLFNIKVENNNA